ncbi:hypothetical protein DPMN_003029 [Dreissena polymorpha]|uniref:Uncharacterized protein n=1 Tax=Dreissena polymorpha TaxID=45954 RepID=A0A9D4MMG5_DREPO|nr:hypothetical protein DPMN_003029 [Dreissena polymorpha]
MDGPKPGEKLKLGVEPDNLSYENLLVTKMQNSLRTDISAKQAKDYNLMQDHNHNRNKECPNHVQDH